MCKTNRGIRGGRVILSVDLGLSNYGYVVYNTYGQITKVGVLQTKKTTVKITRTSDDYASRVLSLRNQLNRVILSNNILAVVGEAPSLGGQSSTGVRDMAVALAISVCVFTEHNLPVEWCTPEQSKVALTGKKTASKQDMMYAAVKNYSWKVTFKSIYIKKTGNLQRIDSIYHPMGIPMGANKFEHVADAIGAAHALRDGNIIKMYLKRR